MRARSLRPVFWDRMPPTAPDRPGAGTSGRWPRTVLTRAESTLLLAAVPLLAISLWILGVLGTDPRRTTSAGLLSPVGPATVAGLALLVGCLVVGLLVDAPDWLLGVHLVCLLVLVHGTPALLGNLTGQRAALSTATWAWLALTLVILLVLRHPLRGLGRHRRLVWLGLGAVTVASAAGAGLALLLSGAALGLLALVWLARSATRWRRRSRTGALAESSGDLEESASRARADADVPGA